ncbi:MAG: protein kinase [Pirellulales bacterium]|nr:protein kinase [Pirellulales bacterium]
MIDPSISNSESLSAAWELDQVMQRFELAWQVSPPDLKAFLTNSRLDRQALLQELILVDLEHRLRRGLSANVEQYFQRFPEVAATADAAVAVIVEDYRQRIRLGIPVSRAEYFDRFPQWHTALEARLHTTAADDVSRSRTWLVCSHCQQPRNSRESSSGTLQCAHCGAAFELAMRFVVMRRIGSGGMGVVYEALDRERNCRVALKVLPHVHATALYRFKQEFRSLADVLHPNLVVLHELIADGQQWFITMELVDGVDFLTYVRGLESLTTGQLDTARTQLTFAACNQSADQTTSLATQSSLVPTSQQVLQYAGQCEFDRLRDALRQLTAALTAIHGAGKLHRDIKPSNVLIRPDGRLAVLDFGLATELCAVDGVDAMPDEDSWAVQHTDAGPVGTVAYMSPEQAAGKPLSPASDWYSVGVMLFVSMTGRLPFEGRASQVLYNKQYSLAPAPRDLAPEIPAYLDELCCRLLSRDPAQRPTATDLLAVLQDSNGEDPRVDSVPHPTAPLLVGRSAELGTLREACARVLAGSTVVVHLHGRSGMGKSLLLARLKYELEQVGDALLLSGRCYEQESVPYKTLDSVVDALSHYLAALPRAKVEAVLPRDVAALARVFPVLQRIPVIVEMATTGLQVNDLQELRRRAFLALRELLGRLGSRRTLVIAIDDLQWGDAEGARRLVELVQPPDAPRLLLLLLYRSDTPEENDCLELLRYMRSSGEHFQVVDLPLERLPEDMAAVLAEELLGASMTRSVDLTHQIARASQGNPFFIAELVRNVVEGGWGQRASTASVDLDDVLWSRITQLPADAQQLLQVVAIADQPLRLRNAYEAAQLRTGSQELITTLRAAGFVRSNGLRLDDTCETYHDRIRECVRGRLPAAIRQGHHFRLAESLERHQAADPETVAAHFRAAGELSKAVHYYHMAAEAADRSLAFERAAKLYRLCLQLDPAEPANNLRIKLADALANAGLGVQAGEMYRRAARDTNGSLRIELERRAAHQFLISGHLEQGRQVMDAVMRSVNMRMPRTERGAWLSVLAQQVWFVLRGLRFRERPVEKISVAELSRLDICWSTAIGIGLVDVIRAADLHARTLRLALRAGDRPRVLRSLALETIYVAAGGSRTEKQTNRFLKAAEEQAHDFTEPYGPALVTLAYAASAYLQGQNERAYLLSLQAEQGFRSHCIGSAWEIDVANNYRFWSLVMLGNVAELDRTAREVLVQAQERGDLFGLTNLATYPIPHAALWAHDDPTEALEGIKDALRRWPQHGFFVQHLAAMIAAAEAHLYRGRPDAARQLIASQWPAYQKSLLTLVQQGYVEALFARARSAVALAAEAGDPKPLLRDAERDARRLVRERNPRAAALASIVRSSIAACSGKRDIALGELELALPPLLRSDRHLYAAIIRKQIGRLRGGTAGQELCHQSEAWLAQRGIRNPDRVRTAILPGFTD